MQQERRFERILLCTRHHKSSQALETKQNSVMDFLADLLIRFSELPVDGSGRIWSCWMPFFVRRLGAGLSRKKLHLITQNNSAKT